MKDFKFGIDSEELETKGQSNDFVTYEPDAVAENNPYNQKYFDSPEKIASCKSVGSITSIPSPYARMLLTDLAFREYNSGNGRVPFTVGTKHKDNLSADYKRALSHCLDIYELLYNTDYNFRDKGITITKLDLASTNSQDPEIRSVLFDANGDLTSVGLYVKTLELYRNEYVKEITTVVSGKGIPYTFDFSSLYLFKYNDKTFAATSPFTGFFAKGDCNVPGIEINGNRLLSEDSQSWRMVEDRDYKFREFLYLLLKDTDLDNIFVNMFEALEFSFTTQQKSNLKNDKFGNLPIAPKFNLYTDTLPQLKTTGTAQLFIRHDGLDCSYLKYLLYLKQPVDLSITQMEYGNKDVTTRKFPSNGQQTHWFGPNDILSDALFVLNYDINDNYTVVPYTDKRKKSANLNDEIPSYRRCLLPIKMEALNYFSMETLVQNLEIERRQDDEFIVTLRLELTNGGDTKVRRVYRVGSVEPNGGRVVCDEQMDTFAFGVYPLVKSTKSKNIYKILFYNNFDNKYKLKFYSVVNNKVNPFLEQDCLHNRTNDKSVKHDGVLDYNCDYHDVRSQNGLDLVELSIEGLGTSLIVPKMHEVSELPYVVVVAIDFGTSNTYMSYTVADETQTPPEPRAICTHHKPNGMPEWNELAFMNKECDANAYKKGTEDKNKEDLILRVSDDTNLQVSEQWSRKCLDSQLCEFIPTRIDPSMGNSSYSFPIPSVINFLLNDSKRVVPDPNNDTTDVSVPLLHCSIPFAYYERGSRDSFKDQVKNGSNFKWFYRKDRTGLFGIDKSSESGFKAYVSELLFIVRSHMLCCGYDLSNVKLIWSYPLSFDKILQRQHEAVWAEVFKDIMDVQDVNGKLISTSESRTPIFECLKNPSAINKLTILVDIGGGSTDVIGYKSQKPLFLSSFKFAGNALYLAGSLNKEQSKDNRNSLFGKLASRIPILNQNSSESQTISIKDPIDTIMNYLFAKHKSEADLVMNQDYSQFILRFHNAALIFHIAQLCKMKSPDEAPVEIHLTGNGSKLFKYNLKDEDGTDTVKKIFEYVYESSELKDSISKLKVWRPDDPKAATARGALKGYHNGQLVCGGEASQDKVVLLGDAYTEYSDGDEVDDDYLDNVKENVKDFVEMFYTKLYKEGRPVFTKQDVLSEVESVKGEPSLEIDPNSGINDSLFFQYITLVMEGLSFTLASRI